jgi:hypothetical protein
LVKSGEKTTMSSDYTHMRSETRSYSELSLTDAISMAREILRLVLVLVDVSKNGNECP